jgi:RimJ/RimL family protein N-acetyltransferase
LDNRPLGPLLPDWLPPGAPRDLHLTGDWAELTPLDADQDAPGLFAAFAGHDWVWDYLYEPPMKSVADLHEMLAGLQAKVMQPCLVIRAKGQPAPLGYACFWTVVTASGNIEIGNVNFSPAMQRTPAATEAFYLMIDWAFGAGYRRVEWKCNALNAPSRSAAQRLGFSYEGTFRQHLVVKGRNRDTAWFAMTDSDWVNLGPCYRRWLAPDNFTPEGRQRLSLSTLTAPHLFARDPSQGA